MPTLDRLLDDHPGRVRLLLGLLLALLLLPISFIGVAVLSQQAEDWPYLLWALAFSLPAILVLRRPELTLLLALPAIAAQLVVTDMPLTGDVVLLIALAAVCARHPWRRARWSVAAVAALCLVFAVDWTFDRLHVPNEPAVQAGSVLTVFAVLLGVEAASVMLGLLVRTQRSQADAWEQTAAALEHDQQLMMDLAASEERARIAADMHDIVAHSLAVIAVQTDAAQLLLTNANLDDGGRRKALQAVTAAHDTSVTALRDTRQLVGALAEAADDARAPQPTLARLVELVGRLDPTGARVRLETDLDLSAVPMPLPAQAACHRIVQEALSNVLHHAGPKATAVVGLREEAGMLLLTVTDDGPGHHETDRQGHGLASMAQRAHSVGGSLVAGPRPGGGFEVSARIPLSPEAELSPEGEGA